MAWLGLFLSSIAPQAGPPLTGLFGVDEQRRDAGTSGLLRDECRPETASYERVAAAGLDPFVNAFEVFKTDAATGVLRLQHDRLRDAVVFVSLEPPLFSRELAKFAFGGLGAATLQPGSALRAITNSKPLAFTLGFGTDRCPV